MCWKFDLCVFKKLSSCRDSNKVNHSRLAVEEGREGKKRQGRKEEVRECFRYSTNVSGADSQKI